MTQKIFKRSNPCMLCNSYTSDIIYEKDFGKYVKCRKCGLVSVDPLPSYDEMIIRSEYWAEEHHKKEIKVTQHFSSNFQDFAYNEYLNIMKSYRITNRVLDIGCGIGSFVYAASRNGWESIGIDVGPALTVARDYQLKVFKGKIEDMNFPKNYFDVITMFDVIEHILDIDSLIYEIGNCLRDNGLLIIKTPNISSLTSLILKEKWSSIQPRDHINLFSKKTINILLRKHQFKIIKDKTIDLNLFDLKKIIEKPIKKGINSQEYSKRELIWKIINSKSLRIIRDLVNYFLNIFGLGESIIVYAKKNRY